MIKNILRRIFSVASALAIVFTAYPPVIIADDGGLCPHHLEHTPECGYVEGVSPCNFVCEICDVPEVTTAPGADAQDGTGGEPEPLPAPNFSPFALNGEHNCNGISDWQAWEETDRLPETPGSYYLTNDVTLSDTWYVNDTVNLCLNGRSIECSSYGEIRISGGNLTVYNCRGVGKIRSRDNFSDLVNISYGTFTLKDGNIESSGSAIYGGPNSSIIIDGGGVSGEESGIRLIEGNVEVNGGKINGMEYGIRLEYADATLALSGDPIITGGTADIYLANGKTITIDNQLTATDISIKMDKPGVFATVKGGSAEEYVDNFTSKDNKYAVVAEGDSLKLVEVHRHADGKEFTAWSKTDSLPTEPGDYYLTQNVTLGNIWLPTGAVSICLNGNKIDLGSENGCLYVLGGSSLNLYDCKDGDGITKGGDFPCIQCEGTVIINSGKINHTARTPILITNGGNLTINDGEITGVSNGVQVNDGKLTVNGGTIQSTDSFAIDFQSAVEINGGTIQSQTKTAVYNAAYNSGTLTVRGGKFIAGEGERNYGIEFFYDDGNLILSGDPTFSGGKAGIRVASYSKIEFDGALETKEPILIDVALKNEAFTVNASKYGITADKFTFIDTKNYPDPEEKIDYKVQKVGSELWLVPKGAHVHDDETIFLPWDKEDSLPDSQGNWYLTQPVNLTGGWNVPGDVNLCLNGQKVDCQGSELTVGSGSSLTVYDDLDKKGEINGSSDTTIYVNGGEFTLIGGKISNIGMNGKAIKVENGGTASIQGGNVESTYVAIYGATASTINVTGGEIKGGSGSLVYAIESSGTLEISGGNITSAEDKAVRISSDCNFNLSGSPTIDGIRLDGGSVITIDKALSGKYVVYGAENRVFAQGSCAAEAIKCFMLPQDLQGKGYVIVAVENGLKATILHEHDGINFEVWNEMTSLPSKAGNYFLNSMVMLSNTWVVPEGETTLCLNGSMIMSRGGNIDIPENATLIICDCSIHSSGGIIFENAACINVSGKLILKSGAVENSLSGKAINVGGSGLLIIEDGKVNGDECAIHGESGSDIIIRNGEISGDQGPAISTAGNLTVSGGDFSGTLTHAIDVTGELTLTGTPNISINGMYQYSADIHVAKPINIPNRVNGSYSVYMEGAPCVFAKGKGAAESVNSFTSADENSEVQKVGSELWLVPKGAHVHEEDGTIFLPWDSTDSLPTAAGNYYLKNDVKIEIFGNNWTVQGNAKLCLNGHKISFASMKWAEVPESMSLTVYDCDGAGSIVGGALHCINKVEGTFTLEGGTIESAGSGEAINVGNGNIVINGGTVNGDVSGDYSGYSITITGGQINGEVSALGDLNISGGTITSSYTAVYSQYGSFALSNTPTIEGSIDLVDTSITISEKLEGGPYIIDVIRIGTDPYTFATGDGAVDSIGCFKLTAELESAGYEIVAVDDTLVVRLKTYTIKYESGEGEDISGNSFTETKTHGTDITISSEKFTRPGYTQIGWSTEQGANEVKYAFGANYADNENLTLYPVWEKNEIHFYKGAEEIESLSLKVGEIAEISASITPNSAVCDPVKWTAEAGISIDPDTGETITVTGNSVGEFELTASTDDGLTTKSLTVTVSRSDSTVSAEDQTVTYGDEVTITATVKKAASSGISLMANYDNKVTFKLGDNELGTADVVSDTATLTISATRAKGFKIGDNTVTLEYSGNGALNPIDGSVTVTVNRKTLTATITGTTTKTYDGTASADDLGLELKLTGVVSGDTVGASAEFAYDSADVGKRTISAANAKLNGEHAGYYELSTLIPTVSGTISPLAVELVWTGDEFAYNGEPHTVTATVKNAVVGDEIKLTYSENTATNVGNYTAEVTDLGNANYTLDGATGIEHKWKITALSLANAQVEIVGTYTYNGKVQTPEIRVTLGGKELSAGDYTATYSGEVKNANTYTVTLTGMGNYSGSAEAEFEIAPKSLTASISGTLNKVYDGTADVNDDVKIALTGVVESDVVTATAEISYDSENVGTRKIVAKNIELSGEDAKNYTLSSNKAEASGSIAPAPITLPDSSFIYGGGNKTVIQVSGIGETVTATLTAFSGNAGEYEYSEAAKENSYTVELSSENYKVQSAGKLTVKPLMAVLEWQGGKFTYDGTVHEVKATVKNAVTGDIFNITYTENTATNAGDYTAKVTALGNANYTLSGANEYEWKIAPRIAEIEWAGDEFTYDGKSHTVTAAVKNAVENDKFEIEYAENTATNAGDYTAKVTALGNANYTLSGATGVEHEWQITAASQAAPEVKIDFINETLSTDEAMEFSADGETWQDCTAAMNVAKTGWNGSALTVKIRYKKDENHLDGEIQTLVIPARREAPDISEATVSKSQTEISIAEIAGCEYSLDGVIWQDNGSFSGLDEGETYEIHVRYKATSSAFASFVTSKTVVTSSTSDGTTELLPGETVASGDGSITNYGDKIVIDDGEGNETTVTLPDGGSVEVDEQGCVTVPGGGEVAVGDNPAIILPEGGKVEPDGTVTADEVKIGDTDVKGEDVTVEPDGNITVPGEGSVKVGDNPEITLPTGGTVEPDGTVTADEVKVRNTDVKGEDVTVEPDGNITVPNEGHVTVGDNPEIILPTGGTVEPDGTVTSDEVKVGDTDVKGEDVTVEPDGKITLPNGGSVAVEGEPEKIVPAGTTVENGKINAPAIAEPADGSGSLGDDIILKIESADERLETSDRENLKDVENAIVREVYDIELLKNGTEIQPDKLIKLTVSADVGGAKMKVFMLDNGKFAEIDAEFDAENGTFSVVTDSLGIFVLASEEGQISAEVVASGDAPEVEISDDDRKILEENLFTDDDEAAIENGDNVKVVMNVDGISEEDVSANNLAEIEAFLDDLEDCEVAEHADITLTKITEDGVTGDEIKSEAIAEISNPIKLVFDIPEALHKVGRIFSVIRLHDGKAELLNDTDQSDETVTILTDKFSLYVLIYRDPKSQPSHVHSFTAWINVGASGHLVRCAVCGEVMSLMPHTLLNGVCTACGYVLHGYLPDEGDVIEIEVPTEGRIADEEVEF